MGETELSREGVVEEVFSIISGVIMCDLEQIKEDTRILSIPETDRGDLAEICFRIEQRLGLGRIVESQGYNNKGRSELGCITAGEIADFVCQEVGV